MSVERYIDERRRVRKQLAKEKAMQKRALRKAMSQQQDNKAKLNAIVQYAQKTSQAPAVASQGLFSRQSISSSGVNQKPSESQDAQAEQA